MQNNVPQNHQQKALPPGPYSQASPQGSPQGQQPYPPQQGYPPNTQGYQPQPSHGSYSNMQTPPQHNAHQPYPPQPQQPYPPQPHQYQQHPGAAPYPPYQAPPPQGYQSPPGPNQVYPSPNGYPPQNPIGYQQHGPASPQPQGYYHGPPQTPTSGHPGYQQHTGGPPPLYDEYGMQTAEFQRYSTAFFNFLDANYAPKNSRAIEQNKIKAFMESLGVDKNRNIGALPANVLEDFYTHFGIPFTKGMAPPTIGNAVNVASTVFKGANLLANVLGGGGGMGGGFGGGLGGGFGGGLGGGLGGGSQSSLTIPVIDASGFATLFSNAVKRNPNGMFIKVNECIQRFHLPVPPLQRPQLPAGPDPMVQEQYKQYEQLMMMKMKMKMQQTQMVAQVAINGAHNVQQASLPAGYYYKYS